MRIFSKHIFLITACIVSISCIIILERDFFILSFRQQSEPTVELPSPAPTATPTPQITSLSAALYTNMKAKLIALVQTEDPKAAIVYLQKEVAARPAWERVCHALAHEIGHAAYDKYHDYTVAVTYRDDLCGSGYLHGLIEYRLKGVDPSRVGDVMKTICPSENAEDCYHGVGHGAMFFTSNDVPKSVAMCNNTYVNDAYKVACGEGVFMENFNTDQTVHVSKYLDPTDPFSLCRKQDSIFKGPCYYYAPDYYLQLYPDKYTETFNWCDSAESGYSPSCYGGAGSRLMKYNIDSLEFVRDVCEKTTDVQRPFCIDGAVNYHLVHYHSRNKTTHEFCSLFENAERVVCTASVQKREALFPL